MQRSNRTLLKQNSILLSILLLIGLGLARFIYLGYAPLRYDEIHNLIRSVEFDVNIENIFLEMVKGSPSQFLHFLSVKSFGPNEFATRFPVVIQAS